jgi:hypothetical protein
LRQLGSIWTLTTVGAQQVRRPSRFHLGARHLGALDSSIEDRGGVHVLGRAIIPLTRFLRGVVAQGVAHCAFALAQGIHLIIIYVNDELNELMTSFVFQLRYHWHCLTALEAGLSL